MGPFTIETCKSNNLIIWQVYIPWDFLLSNMLPFKKPPDGHQASFGVKGRYKRWFCTDALCSCVEGSKPYLLSIFSIPDPFGYKSPFQHANRTLITGANGGYFRKAESMVIITGFIAIFSGEIHSISFLDLFLNQVYIYREAHYFITIESSILVFRGTIIEYLKRSFPGHCFTCDRTLDIMPLIYE